MSALRRIRVRLRGLLLARATDRELDEEIQFHLDRQTEKNLEAGMDPKEARRLARIAFGGVEAVREAHRDGWGLRWLRDLPSDARHASRVLRRSPALTAAATLTLALGIGANAAIFSAFDAVILRPLPFAEPDRLVMLWESNPGFHWHQQVAAPANVLDWKEQVAAFADVAAYADFGERATLRTTHGPRLVTARLVTGNFFSVLGVDPERGRLLRDAETWKTGDRVAVISDRLWRTTFASDTDIAGRVVQLDGTDVRIVGVAPASFGFPDAEVEAWVPFGWDPAIRDRASFRRAHWLRAVARLRPGVTLAGADAGLQAVAASLRRKYPDLNHAMGAGLTPLHDFLVRDTRPALVVLLAAVGLLLLIACANVANLQLVHALGRERETVVRRSLGAGRGRLLRQALTESLVLSALGGLLGLGLGWWGTAALVALQPPGMLPLREAPLNGGVLAYVLAVTVGSGLVFGAAPALWASRRVPAEVLREGGRTGTLGGRFRRSGEVLVVVEVGLALLLTVGAGLLLRSLWALERVDPGFEPRNVLAVELQLGGERYAKPDRLVAFYDELAREAGRLPGVESASATSEPPLTTWGWTSQLSVAGRPPGQFVDDVAHREVTPGYFRTLRVPILQGRDFTERDGAGAPYVVLINQALARACFPGQDPIGQRIAFDKIPDARSTWRTIVGIVGDEHQSSLGVEVKMQVIAPFAQEPRRGMVLMLRTRTDPLSLAPSVRRLVSRLDPGLAISSIRTMDEIRDASLARPRFLMTMMLVFAGVGLLLAVVGVYGVVAQFARSRTRELGIRMALGARASEVRWLVVRRGLWPVAGGLLVGLGAAVLAVRAMRAFLYGVVPLDPATFLAVPALLLLTAAAAIWLPARRASLTDPSLTLRTE